MSDCCDFCVNNGCYACCTCGDSFEPEEESMSEPIIIYIIRNVLTQGIIEAQGAHRCAGSPELVNWGMETFGKDEYELDLLSARIKAILLRKEKVNELRNEINRLEDLEF